MFWNGIFLFTALSSLVGCGSSNQYNSITYRIFDSNGNLVEQDSERLIFTQVEDIEQFYYDVGGSIQTLQSGPFNYSIFTTGYESYNASSAYNATYSVTSFTPSVNGNSTSIFGMMEFDYSKYPFNNSPITDFSGYSRQVFKFDFAYDQELHTSNLVFDFAGQVGNPFLFNAEIAYNITFFPNIDSTYHVNDSFNEFNTRPFVFSKTFEMWHVNSHQSYDLGLHNLIAPSTQSGSSFYGILTNISIRLVDIVNTTDNIYSSGYDVGYSEGGEVGYDNGFDTGYHDGYDVGYNDAAAEYYEDGYDQGYHNGYEEAGEDYYGYGFDDGYNYGREDGYNVGKVEGFALGQSHDTQFMELMGTVIDTPIVALRRLFSYEVFGINLFQALMTIITLLIAYAIFRIVVRF